jgi:hypothetical protein
VGLRLFLLTLTCLKKVATLKRRHAHTGATKLSKLLLAE